MTSAGNDPSPEAARAATIAEGWAAAQMALSGVSPEEQTLTKRAFYGGAAAMFQIIVDILGAEGDETSDADLRRMDALAAELDAFPLVYRPRRRT